MERNFLLSYSVFFLYPFRGTLTLVLQPMIEQALVITIFLSKYLRVKKTLLEIAVSKKVNIKY